MIVSKHGYSLFVRNNARLRHNHSIILKGYFVIAQTSVTSLHLALQKKFDSKGLALNGHRAKACIIPFIALVLAAGSATVSAAELGRKDITAPGAMISVGAGLTPGSYSDIGDKGAWLGNDFNSNSAQTASPTATVAQSVTYSVLAPATSMDADAHGQAAMGQMKLFAHSRASQGNRFALAEATGGWVDNLTLNAVNPAQTGQTATFSFKMNFDGTLSGQGVVDSFNSLAKYGIQAYINDAALFQPTSFEIQGQGQQGFRYDRTVNQSVIFSTNVTLGTAFEFGMFARVIAGNASTSLDSLFSEATVDFSNTISWGGITGVKVGGVDVDYTLGSASGIDWRQPFATAVPEPEAYALLLAGLGLLGFAARCKKLKAA